MLRRAFLVACLAIAFLGGSLGVTPAGAGPPLDNGGGWTTYPDMNDNSGIDGQAFDGEIPAVPALGNNQTSLANIASAYNRARGIENTNICPAGACEPGAAVMPTNMAFPADYLNRSFSERALWLLNSERVARGLLPFEGVDPAVATNAQTWAQHLIDQNSFHHQGQPHPDGSPSLGAREAIEAICNGCVGNIGTNAAENLYSRSEYSLPNRAILDDFGLERAFYGWMYEDRESGGTDQRWGHRHALLWNNLVNDHGPAGSEGFIAIGVAKANDDLGTFLGERQAVVWVAIDSNANYGGGGGGGGDTTPPVVTFRQPNVFVDQGSPQTVSGTISDAGSGVGFMQLVAIDIGYAGAPGTTPGVLRYWDGFGWVDGPASNPPFLPVSVVGDIWSFGWDPVVGGSGSYSLGLRAFDNAGNKWPADKPWQALVIISDTTGPTLNVAVPVVGAASVSWSGSATDDVAVRKFRMIVRHVDSNTYWNGVGWVDKDQALADLADPNRPNITLTPDQSNSMALSSDWSFTLNTERSGQFLAAHWAQNGAYTWSPIQYTSVFKQPTP
jgi:hypothetical protein